MSERERGQAKALEYARSQGWINPSANSFGGTSTKEASERCVELERQVEALERGQQVAVDALAEANERVRLANNAALEMKKCLEARAPHLRKRITALEAALRGIDEAEKREPSSSRGAVEVALNAARAVLLS